MMSALQTLCLWGASCRGSFPSVFSENIKAKGRRVNGWSPPNLCSPDFLPSGHGPGRSHFHLLLSDWPTCNYPGRQVIYHLIGSQQRPNVSLSFSLALKHRSVTILHIPLQFNSQFKSFFHTDGSTIVPNYHIWICKDHRIGFISWKLSFTFSKSSLNTRMAFSRVHTSTKHQQSP